MVVTNQTLAPLYLDQLTALLTAAGVKVDQVILPDGEQYKTLAVMDQVLPRSCKSRTVVIRRLSP